MRALIVLLSIAVAAPVSAAVVSSSPNGFHVRHQLEIAAPPEHSFRTFGQVKRWWNPAHTYSGDANNLSLPLTPGACFCEKLPNGGGIEHMRLTYVDPGKRAVLTGGLGPLLFEATSGALDLQWEAAGAGTRFTFDYKVAGFAGANADKLAPIVDQVLAEQVKRYAAFAAH